MESQEDRMTDSHTGIAHNTSETNGSQLALNPSTVSFALIPPDAVTAMQYHVSHLVHPDDREELQEVKRISISKTLAAVSQGKRLFSFRS